MRVMLKYNDAGLEFSESSRKAIRGIKQMHSSVCEVLRKSDLKKELRPIVKAGSDPNLLSPIHHTNLRIE